MNKCRQLRVLSVITKSCPTIIQVDSDYHNFLTLPRSMILGEEFPEEIVTAAEWWSDRRRCDLDIWGSLDWV